MKSSSTALRILFLYLLTSCFSCQPELRSESALPVRTEESSCGPQSLSAYSKLSDNGHEVAEIYDLVKKQEGEVVNLLELKQAAQQLGFEAEGRLLDVEKLDGIESYAIIPVGEDKTGSQSDPLHFVLVRISKGKVFQISEVMLEEKPIEPARLKEIWKGPALVLF